MDAKKPNVHDTHATRGLTRKLFFERLGWLGIMILGLAGIPALLRFLKPRTAGAAKGAFDAGSIDDLRSAPVSTRWLKRHRLWVVHDRDRLVALEARCTHLGCTPRWDSAAGLFNCPCHGSLFTPHGIPLNGPAVEPLHRFAIWSDGDRVMIDPSVKATLEEAELNDEFVVHLPG
jgi:cytochrome b6-f complex iron-sulfur subunit